MGRSFAATISAPQDIVRRGPIAGPARFLHRRLWSLSAAGLNARDDVQTAEVVALARIRTTSTFERTPGELADRPATCDHEHHVAFEPLPHLAAQLRRDFPMVEVSEVAL